jgi:uracil-DNA glycosylase
VLRSGGTFRYGGAANARLVDARRHVIVSSGHPSPLSQHRFFGTHPLGRANEGLAALGAPPVGRRLAE